MTCQKKRHTWVQGLQTCHDNLCGSRGCVGVGADGLHTTVLHGRVLGLAVAAAAAGALLADVNQLVQLIQVHLHKRSLTCCATLTRYPPLVLLSQAWSFCIHLGV